MGGSGRGGHRTEDIRGQDCSVCCKGVAHVVFFKARNRFFFGCNASTVQTPCRGPKEWQSVDVPVELRKIPEAPPLPVVVKDEPKKERKRRVGDDHRDGESESEEEREEERVKWSKKSQISCLHLPPALPAPPLSSPLSPFASARRGSACRSCCRPPPR